MEKTKKGVNYKATEDFLDQLRSFIIDRYTEIYHYNPLEDPELRNNYQLLHQSDVYNELLYMLQACYENDMSSLPGCDSMIYEIPKDE